MKGNTSDTTAVPNQCVIRGHENLFQIGWQLLSIHTLGMVPPAGVFPFFFVLGYTISVLVFDSARTNQKQLFMSFSNVIGNCVKIIVQYLRANDKIKQRLGF